MKNWLLASSLLLSGLTLVPSIVTAKSITLVWEDVVQADHFRLEEQVKAGDESWSAWMPISPSQRLSHTMDKDLGNYKYRVIGCLVDPANPETPLCDEVAEYSNDYLLNVSNDIGADWVNLTATTANDALFNTVSVPENENVGSLPGQATVSGGQASYNIPVRVAPGRNNMQPNVALVYSSSSGSGVAGVGWSLSAGGAIQRCPSTYAQDGKLRAVQLDGSDKLCLNGQRLIATGSVGYGEDGAVYRTELDTFVRVTQSGDISSNDVSFSVLAKDGSTSYYGSTADSKVIPYNATLEQSWLLAKQFDTSGNNHISYYYDEFGAGEVLLTDIYYTGNGSTDGDRRVNFIYEMRDDNRRSQLRNTVTQTTRRLKLIHSYVGSTRYWTHTLGYKYSDHSSRSLLTSVQIKDKNNIALPTSTFEWLDSVANIVLEPLEYRDGTDTLLITDDLSINSDNYRIQSVLPRGDVNGDGVRDWRGVFLNAEREKTGDNNLVVDNCLFVQVSRTWSCIEADFNRDGLTDGWVKTANDKMQLMLTQPDGSTTPVNTNINIKSQTIRERTDYVTHIADYNGDGWPDVMVHEHNDAQPRIRFYQHSGSPDFPYQSGQVIYSFRMRSNPSGFPFKVSDIQFQGDLNGSGLPDIVVTDTYHEFLDTAIPQPYPDYFLFTSTTTAGDAVFTTNDIPLPMDVEALSNVDNITAFSMFFDVNGDGLSDILGFFTALNRLQVLINKGDGSFTGAIDINGAAAALPVRSHAGSFIEDQALVALSSPKYLDGFKVADINLDGKPELIMPGQRLVTGCATISEATYSGGTFQNTRCGEELYQAYLAQPFTETTVPVNSKLLDDSVYAFDALYFDIGNDNTYSVRKESTPYVGPAVESAFIDATGNGLQDFVFAYGARESVSSIDTDSATDSPMAGLPFGYYIQVNYGAGNGNTPSDYKPLDLVSKTINGLGMESEWEYRPLSSDVYDSLDQPYYTADFNYTEQFSRGNGEYLHFASSMYTVAEFKQDNGIGGTNSTLYNYVGAVYNTSGRGFQGFREIHTYDVANYTKGISAFEQIFPLTGRLVTQTSYSLKDIDDTSSWSKVSETTTSWEENASHNVANTEALYHTYPQQSVAIRYALSTGTEISRTTSTVNTIDQWGNVTDQTVSTVDGNESFSVRTEVDITSDDTIWWLDKVNSTTTTYSSITRSTGDLSTVASDLDADRVVTVTNDTFDELHRKPTKVVTTADDAQKRKRKTDKTGTENIAADNFHSMIVNTQYNAYGLPSSLETEGSVYVEGTTPTWITQKRKSKFTSYTKNGTSPTADGYFPYEVENALGHGTTTTTDVALGMSLSAVDDNGVSVTNVYDGFGRPISVSATGQPTQYQGHQGIASDDSLAPANAVTRLVTRQAGAPESIEYQDLFGRPVRTTVQGFSADSYYLSDIEYDARGLTIFESMPYINGDTRYGTRYTSYDALGRLTEKQIDQVGTTLTTSYTHLGYRTDIVAGGLSMSRTYNARKQLLKTTDAESGITRYAYDNMGNPVVIQDANGNMIKAKYNGLGHKLWVDDPNMGKSWFVNNTFGEVELELDANKDMLDFTFDQLGRITQRRTLHFVSGMPDTTAIFMWDDLAGANCKVGLLCHESEDGMERSYHYDNALRVTQTDTTLDGTSYTVNQQYDAGYGRPKALQYPNGLTIELLYNDRGYLTHEQNAATGYVYRQVTEMDAFGNIENANTTDGLVSAASIFSRKTGQMLSSSARMADENLDFHHLTYTVFDRFGNLKTANNEVTNTQETYVYDDLHRLTNNEAKSNGAVMQTVTYDYDAVGNFKYKSDYSTTSATAYQYGNATKSAGGNAGANAVRQVQKLTASGSTAVNFSYDNKGNMTSGDGLTTSYFAYGKPYQVTRNSVTSTFRYGSDRMRYKQVKDGKTTYYIDKLYEVEGNNWRAYISDVAVINYTAENEAENVDEDIKIRYTHRDRLGSALTLTDHLGNVSERRRFDAFGKPRSIDGGLLASPTMISFGGDSAITNRGFTDHEHLDDQQLIHMNGRVYDYNLGRFMSVDPFVHEGSQGLNPYSYIMNNPLSGTDPTGYEPEDVEVKVKVSRPGSRIKSTVTVSATSDGNGGHTITISGGNGADRNAVKSAVSGTLSAAGFNVSDIGSQAETAQQTPSSGKSEDTGVRVPIGGESSIARQDDLNFNDLASGNINRDEFEARSNELSENADIPLLAVPMTAGPKVLGWLGKLAKGAKVSKEALKAIRTAYVGEVKALKGVAEALSKQGFSPKQIANVVHGMRRTIGEKYKHITPFLQRQMIYVRNRAPRWMGGKGYDSIYGPSVNWLRKSGKSWDDIIQSASKPSDAINKSLGVK